MEALKITAHMGTAIATYDSWSPSLDSLIEWLILDKLNLTSPNPTPEQIEATCSLIDREMPVTKVYDQFTVLLGFYEQLMALGFFKTEIDGGNYRSDRLMANLADWEPLEEAIASHRCVTQDCCS